MSKKTLLEKEKVADLRLFISLLEEDPDVIHAPELHFFRTYIQKLGAKIPPPSGTNTTEDVMQEDDGISEEEIDSEDDEEWEADSDKDDGERVETDALPAQEPIRVKTSELTEDELDVVDSLKKKVAHEIDEGNLEEARKTMTEILMCSNPTAMLYAKRAEINLKLKCPNACIADCTSALEYNPDNGKAYRLRGCAYRALGQWEFAHRDLELGQKIDFDDSLEDVQKLVERKWKAIDVKRRDKARRREERERRNADRARRRRQTAARQAYEKDTSRSKPAQNFSVDDFDSMDDKAYDSFPESFDSGSAPGGGSSFGGLGNLLGGLMGNPETKKALNNPKVLQAVMELMQNPSSFSKYQNDPEVMSAFTSLMSSMKGAGGGGCCGGAQNCASSGCGPH